MSLEFACITPHPPILIPTIGKKHLDLVQKTKIAMEELEKELYVRRPDSIVVSSHQDYLDKCLELL